MESRVLQCENVPTDWYSYEVDCELSVQFLSLKHAFGQEKYPEMTKLVKAVLPIPHGNADVQRGFSQTTNFLTGTRTSFLQASISALQTTKDGLKHYDKKCHLVPITKVFINKGAKAYKSYVARIEEVKKIEAELKKQKEEEKEKEKEDMKRKKV